MVQARIHDPALKGIGQAHGLDPYIAGARHFDQRQFARNGIAVAIKVDDTLNWHQTAQLRANLGQDAGRARGHNGDARRMRLMIGFCDRQAFDQIKSLDRTARGFRVLDRVPAATLRDVGILLDRLLKEPTSL